MLSVQNALLTRRDPIKILTVILLGVAIFTIAFTSSPQQQMLTEPKFLVPTVPLVMGGRNAAAKTLKKDALRTI